MWDDAPGSGRRGTWLPVAVAVALLFAWAAPSEAGHLACLAGTDPAAADDWSDLYALRRTIDAACPCEDFDGQAAGRSRRDYDRCVRDVVRAAVDDGALRRQCRHTLRTIYRRVTCGRRPHPVKGERVPCVRTALGSGRVSCSIRFPGSCVDGPRHRQVACADAFACTDAADTSGDRRVDVADSGECFVAPAGDIDADGTVDDRDVSLVSACIGRDPRTDPICAPTDLNADGAVRLDDRNLVYALQDALECNRARDLCDRPYDAVAYATTHNAMSNAAEGWAGPNQAVPVPDQLHDGIRGLMLDTHYFPQDPNPVQLCHVACQLGRKPLVRGLEEIRLFLDTHPGEVVTIILEAYISEADTEAAFAASGLIDYVHEQPAGAAWPTLREMIAAGRRLVVFTDDPGSVLPWHHYVWDFAFETHFSAATPEDLSCADNRGTPPADLFILNHFLTAVFGSPGLAAMVNFDPFFIDRALECQAFHGRIPNFVTVDFYDIGDVLAVVDALNGVAGP
jgi:hypothetical protein